MREKEDRGERVTCQPNKPTDVPMSSGVYPCAANYYCGLCSPSSPMLLLSFSLSLSISLSRSLSLTLTLYIPLSLSLSISLSLALSRSLYLSHSIYPLSLSLSLSRSPSCFLNLLYIPPPPPLLFYHSPHIFKAHLEHQANPPRISDWSFDQKRERRNTKAGS